MRGEPIRVLHVEDDGQFAELAGRVLERESDRLSVSRAENGAAALEHLKREEFDCVVSDYRMPGMDGLELLATIREKYPSLPFVLFTGEGSEEIASEAISAGVDDYVRKTGGTDGYGVLATRLENLVAQARAETSYREVFENASVGMAILEPENGRLVDANDRYCELLDQERSKLLDAPFAEISGGEPPYTGDRARDLLAEAVEEGLRAFEWRFEGGSGEQVWASVHLRRARIGGRDRVLATVQNVTDRLQRERQLRANQRKIKALHEAAIEIQACETADEVYESTVTAAEEILELYLCYVGIVDGDVIVPRAFSSRAGPGFVETKGVEEGLAGKTLQTGESYLIDEITPEDPTDPVREEYRAGLSVPIGDRGVFQAVSTESGGFEKEDLELAELLIAHVTATVDRIEREANLREREAELNRQNERLEEFASVVSHDLRGPLSVAAGHLELARQDCDNDRLEKVKSAHQRMDQLIDDVLELARQGRVLSDLETVDLSAVVADAVEVTPLGRATVETDGELPQVRADESRLVSLLENLLTNAVEHGRADVTITIGPLSEGFYVEDDGPGIPPDERDQVFETGYTTSAEGTGFGLSIVREIVDAHGWSIAVTDATGGGARFEVTGVDVCSEI